MRASEIFSPKEILSAAKYVVGVKRYVSTPDLDVDDAVQNLCRCVYRDKKPIDIPDHMTDTVERHKELLRRMKKWFNHVVDRADFDKHLRWKKRAANEAAKRHEEDNEKKSKKKRKREGKNKGLKFLSFEAFETVDEHGNMYNPVEPETKYFKAKYFKVTEKDLQEEVMLATLNYMETCEADTPAHTRTMRRDARVVRRFMNDVDIKIIAKEERFRRNYVYQILSQFGSQVRWNYYWRVPCGLKPVYDIWFDKRRFIDEYNERRTVSSAVTNFSKRVDTAVRCYNEGKTLWCVPSLNGIVKALQRLSLESSLYLTEEEAKTFDDASKKLYELVGKLLKTDQIEFSDDVLAPLKKA